MASLSSGSKPLSRFARIAISAFVAFHLFAIVSWCIPLDSPLTVRCRDLVRPYMVWVGLFQKWDMFAPDPSKLNNYVTAVVVYADGRASTWNFPRMAELGIFEKYRKERYRKFANDNLRLDGFAALWPDAARYIARVNNHSNNPPVRVDLVRHWSLVPPPAANGSEQEAPWSHFTFFRYSVAPGDLQ